MLTFEETFNNILERCSTKEKGYISNSNITLLEDAITFIKQNYKKTITLDDLSRYCCVLKKHFKATSVERASIMYSNAGNLIVPLVTYILGEEWLIYSSAYLIVQLVFMWTHGVRLFSKQKINAKNTLLNVNMLVVLFGFVIMILRLRLPVFIGEIASSLGAMLAPSGMIIAGMLAASVDFKKNAKD